MKINVLILSSIIFLIACNANVDMEDQEYVGDATSAQTHSLQSSTKVNLSLPQNIDWTQLKHVAHDQHTIIAKPRINHRGKTSFQRNSSLKLSRYLSKLNVEIITVPHGVDPFEMIEELRASGDYVYVEPNFQVKLNQEAVALVEELSLIHI